MTEAIDFVVTWVDGDDPDWRADRQRALNGTLAPPSSEETTSRFRSWDTFRHWFRAVERYAPWVNRIHVVTSGQRPKWLDVNHPRINLVPHADIIPPANLPTFNSHAIEAHLVLIPGLSEKFVYFNDDMFLVSPVTPEFFFPRGKPYGVAVFDALSVNNVHAHALLNSSAALSRMHSYRTHVLRNAGAWFTPRYGRDVVRNLGTLPWARILPLVSPHLPTAHTRSAVTAAFAAVADDIARTSAAQFRAADQVAPMYLAYMWAILNGEFTPVNRAKLGDFVSLGAIPLDEVDRTVRAAAKPLLCLNDDLSSDSPEYVVGVHNIMQSVFPHRSEFELF